MFVLPDVKVAVLFNPRTGSHTLHNLLWGLCRDRLAPRSLYHRETGDPVDFDIRTKDGTHLHQSWGFLYKVYPDLDLDSYRAFAFYREPESWFMSALRYMNRRNPHIFHPNMSPRAFWEAETTMKRQVSIIASRWDDEHNIGDIELFNFHDFDNEMIRLFKELNVDLTPELIQEYTIRNTQCPFDRTLTDKDKAQIRKYWWEDYHYLEYKGIELPK